MQFTLTSLLQLALCASTLALPQAPAQAYPPLNANIPPSTTVDLTGQKSNGKFTVKPAPDDQNSEGLQKRAGPLVTVAGIAAVKGTAILVKIAVEIGSDTIKNLGEWNNARETFTKTTTNDMWARNPDYTKFPAAVCYNKGYSLKNGAGIDGLVSAKLELGQLWTDYDCMYMTGNNQFYTHDEGGYINLSYTYNGDRCTFDDQTGDLTCN